jgi:hypothetical protein
MVDEQEREAEDRSDSGTVSDDGHGDCARRHVMEVVLVLTPRDFSVPT